MLPRQTKRMRGINYRSEWWGSYPTLFSDYEMGDEFHFSWVISYAVPAQLKV
jgi:hypothetical protein